MNYQIPEILVNILKLAGYDNIISIEHINDHAIEELEEFMSQNVNLFQSYPNCSKILPGHKAILRALPKYAADFKKKLKSSNESSNLFSFSFIMEELIKTAKVNCEKTPNNNKYSEKLRSFAIYIYIMCGKACYEILSHNLPLPKPATIRKFITFEIF